MRIAASKVGLGCGHYGLSDFDTQYKEEGFSLWGCDSSVLPALFAPVRRCVPSFGERQGPAPPSGSARIWAVVSPLRRSAYSGHPPPPGLFLEDEKKSRIKAGVAGGSSGRSHLPAVRAVTGALRCIKSGVKIRPVLSPLRSRSPKTYCHKEKTGVTHGSGPA